MCLAIAIPVLVLLIVGYINCGEDDYYKHYDEGNFDDDYYKKGRYY